MVNGSKKLMVLTTFLGLYLLSSGLSYAVFSYLKADPSGGFASENVSENRSRIDPSLPKTEICPLNGAMYSKPEKDIWETRRPIAAVIENHLDSRPQSGLSKADIVYEIVAEGGITRFLSIFYCGAAAEEVKIAPVRSARVYLVNWAAEYGKSPIFVHIGGANNICNNCPGGVKPRGQTAREVDAFQLLSTMGWRYAKGNDFDGGTNIGYPVIVRDQFRLGDKAAWEHSVVGFTDKIFDEAKERGFGATDEDGKAWDAAFTDWKFTDGKAANSPDYDSVSFAFSNNSDYNVTWNYDKAANNYKRENGGKPHIDNETKEQITAQNVVIMQVTERGPVDEEKHMFYETIGSGDALIFQNGEVIKGTWKKTRATARTVFSDASGREISFVRGPIWIEAVADDNKITY